MPAKAELHKEAEGFSFWDAADACHVYSLKL